MTFNKLNHHLKKLSIVLLLIIFSSITLFVVNQVLNKTLIKNMSSETSVPTFYLHGYAGTSQSEKYMVNSALQNNITNDVVEAKVLSNGKVTFNKNISNKMKRPIIKIILEDNENKNLEKNAQWIRNVMIAFNAKYHFKKYNFVAHSMGNQSFSYYMLKYGDDRVLPKLNKQVSLAGNFNGEVDINGLDLNIHLDKNGKPNKMLKEYRNLLSMHAHYPKNAEVLNIYGDLKHGTHSDGRVTNVSSESLRYLLSNHIKTFKTYKAYGPKAEHSELHDNEKVTDQINAFLWNYK
ncbi:putative alpha/beta hydrolase family protein [Staphylococcus cohnii]|uniref:Alpha/beta hydrolase n=1 Tax=Staphylococcus cohnii TaxID=29382 RepID=A0ABT6J0S0_9STAP|nr:alpha/beta hydrolase [Staphylococcus cohnii]MCI2940953.1 alpha/beta hydrolase [Staphylococcus cohnii]MDH5139557.1 alpha/beta hydrolase [Staphylococcus cohnii]MDH5158052.1 alpha/beta hydrolase [Staphylococcus cohnii]